MSAIKEELAAFIAAHTSDDFVMTPITMREASLHTAWDQELPKVTMADVVDTVLEGCDVYDVPVRIYIPDTSRPLPVLIYYHGGGFAIDTVAVYDPVCRRIAQATQHIVISPEYRLAPENPYPAAYEDALAVARSHTRGMTEEERRLWQAFLDKADLFPRTVAQGQEDAFSNATRRQLNLVLQEAQEAYNAFVEAHNRRDAVSR